MTPDEYCAVKPTLLPAFGRSCDSKEFKLVYDVGGGKAVKNIPLSPGDRARFAIDSRGP